MGPPDKREPKLSSNAFQHSPLRQTNDLAQRTSQKENVYSGIPQLNTEIINDSNVLQFPNTPESCLSKASPLLLRKVLYTNCTD